MSQILSFNDSNFNEKVLGSDIPVLIDFWAEWCAPCKLIVPIIQEISEEYAGKLLVGKLDVDNNPKVSMNYGIRSIPTLLIFKDGKPYDTIIGAVPKKVIIDKLLPLL